MKFVKKNRNLFSLYEQGKIDNSSLNKDILIKLITDQLIDLGTTIDRHLAYSFYTKLLSMSSPSCYQQNSIIKPALSGLFITS